MTSPSNKPMTVQVIVDDEDVAASISEHLSKIGYHLRTARTGKAGLEQFALSPAKICILNYKLPDIDGIDLLKEINTIAPDTLVIVILSRATIDAAAEAIHYGAYDFLAQPFQLDELETTLFRASERIQQVERLRRVRRRNLAIAASLPLWIGLGYLVATLLWP